MGDTKLAGVGESTDLPKKPENSITSTYNLTEKWQEAAVFPKTSPKI